MSSSRLVSIQREYIIIAIVLGSLVIALSSFLYIKEVKQTEADVQLLRTVYQLTTANRNSEFGIRN